MKSITAYELSNGEIVKDKNEAEQKQNELSLEKGLTTLIGNAGHNHMCESDIVEMIVTHKRHFKELLNKY